MSQKIEFKLPNNAESVAEHLYNVQLEDNCLVFSEFDEEAFDLAVALEGLDQSAYNVIKNRFTARTFDENTLTAQQFAQLCDSPKYKVTGRVVATGLENLNLESLNVSPSFSLTCLNCVLSRKIEEADLLVASLVINTELLEFISLLLFLTERQGNSLNIRTIPEKVELTVQILRPSRSRLLLPGLLKIFNDNQIKEIGFHSSNFVLERLCL